MNADLVELQQSVRQVLAGAAVPADEQTTWPLLIDLGWLLVSVPEELGGLGKGASGACVLQIEMGRRLAAVPCLPAMLAIDAVCQSGLADRESRVERLTGGDYVAAPVGRMLAQPRTDGCRQGQAHGSCIGSAVRGPGQPCACLDGCR